MPGPLADIRVIDLTMWVQGPMASTLLADLGADVIKVEKAGVGDFARNLQSVFGVDLRRGDEPNLLWTICNRNKRGLALDLRDPRARPVFETLVREADVLVTNLMAGPLAEFGADEASVRAINPRIVYARAAGFGEFGPWADDPCQDTVGMAYAGFLFTCSPDGVTPYYPPGAMSDVISGTMMAFGVLAALRERDRTDEGQYVSTSQLQALLWVQSLNFGAVANLGTPFEFSSRTAPPNPMFNTYLCGDGRWLALGMAVPAMWPAMCEAIERPDLASDRRFAGMDARRSNSAECTRILDAHFLTGTAERWLTALRARGLWVAPINRIEDLPADPQVAANNLVITLADGSKAARMPFTLRGHEPGLGRAPEHGEHSDAVLSDIGFEGEAVLELRAAGVVW